MSTPPAGPSDLEVIQRIRDGDNEAFRLLVERYQGRAHRLALRVLRDEEAARDAVQDAFVKAFSALGRFEGRSSFFTWFYRLVMNQCLDAKRRDKSARQQEYDESSGIELTAEASFDPVPEVDGVSFAPAATLMRKELLAHLARAVEQLPDQARETLLLREVEGLSYAEIATTLSIPKGTVMSRLHYARRQVQKLLIEAGVASEAEAETKAPKGAEDVE
ncbi:MAG: sigma-70 family RNA polymerase sigma factor [Myxococcota bacterium]